MADDAGTSYRAQLVRGSAVMVVGRGIGLVAGLAVTVLLARMLGPSGYGVYALAQSVVALLTVPTQLGLPTLVIREIALADEQRNWGLLRGILLWSLRVILSTSVGIGIATIAITHAWRASFAPDFPITLAFAVAFLAISSISTLLQSALQAVRQFALGQLPDLLLLPTLFAGCLTVLSALKVAVTPALAMGVYASCALLSVVVVSIFVRRKLPAQTWSAKPVMSRRAWIFDALPLCLTSGLALVNSQLVVVMIGSLASAKDVGLYRVAASGAGMAMIVGATLGGVVAPYVATFHERGDVVRLSKLATYSAWFGALPAVALLVTYVLAGDKILGLAFGHQFVPALPALIILAVGQTVNAATGAVNSLLNMTGHGRDTLRGTALGAAATLILCAALIPGFGLIGAAVASTVAVIAQNLYLVLRVRLRLNIDSSILPRSPA